MDLLRNNYLVKVFVVVMLLFTASYSYAKTEQEDAVITIHAKPDVVVEAMTFLMPKTVKGAFTTLNKFGYEGLVAKLNNDLKLSNFKFNGTVYSPYLDPESDSYKETALFKMFNHSNDSESSALVLLRLFNFERVLGAFNYIMFVIASVIVFFAISKLSWVSMTVEEDGKSWRKQIILIPSIAIAISLIIPISDLSGVNLAQFMFVIAILIGNALASYFSLIVSMFLFNHVIETTPVSTDVSAIIHDASDDSAKKLSNDLVDRVNQRVMATIAMDSMVRNLLGDKSLTNSSLLLAINEYNEKNGFVGEREHLKLTPDCFSENWLQFLDGRSNEVKACRLFISESPFIFGIDVHDGNIESMTKLAFNELKQYVKTDHINSNALKPLIANNTSVVKNVFKSIYDYQIASVCQRQFSDIYAKGDYAVSDFFSRSFMCQDRSSGDFSTTNIKGLVGSGSLAINHEMTFDAQTAHKNLYSVFGNVANSSVINDAGFVITESKDFYLRGFFISPLEAVMSAIMYIDSKSTQISDAKLSLISNIGSVVVKSIVNLEYPAYVKQDNENLMAMGSLLRKSNNIKNDLAGVEVQQKSMDFWSMFYSDDNKDDKFGAFNMKIIEPYSHMQKTYSVIFPSSIGLFIGSTALNLYMKHSDKPNGVGIRLFSAIISLLGGLFFFLSMLLKLLVGVLFLYNAIMLVLACIKRFVVFSIASTLMCIRSLKDNFSETEDDEENITISHYLIASIFRISVDFVMVTVAIVGSYIVGTLAANLMAFAVILFMGSLTTISSDVGSSSYLLNWLVYIMTNFAIAWGVYQGIKLMSYIYDKTTDFIDDSTGIKTNEEQRDLIALVKTSLSPTAYIMK